MTEGKWLHYSTRQEPELEYAIKGSTRKLREAEAAIKRVRAIAPKDPDSPGSLGVHYRLGYDLFVPWLEDLALCCENVPTAEVQVCR